MAPLIKTVAAPSSPSQPARFTPKILSISSVITGITVQVLRGGVEVRTKYRGPHGPHRDGEYRLVKLHLKKDPGKVLPMPFRVFGSHIRGDGPGKMRRLKRRQQKWLNEVDGPLTPERLEQLWVTPCNELKRKLARLPSLPEEKLLSLLQGRSSRHHMACRDAWENPNALLYLIPTAGSIQNQLGLLSPYIHAHGKMPDRARYPNLYQHLEAWWRASDHINVMLALLFYQGHYLCRIRWAHMLWQLVQRAVQENPELQSPEWAIRLRSTDRKLDRFRRYGLPAARKQNKNRNTLFSDNALLTKTGCLSLLLAWIEHHCTSPETYASPLVYLAYGSDLQLAEALEVLFPDQHLPSLIRELQPTLPPYPG